MHFLLSAHCNWKWEKEICQLLIPFSFYLFNPLTVKMPTRALKAFAGDIWCCLEGMDTTMAQQKKATAKNCESNSSLETSRHKEFGEWKKSPSTPFVQGEEQSKHKQRIVVRPAAFSSYYTVNHYFSIPTYYISTQIDGSTQKQLMHPRIISHF